MIAAWRRSALVLAIAAAPRAAAQQIALGQLVVDTLHSRALEKNVYGDPPNRSMLVYLPASYTTSPAKRYPVVYLLHGFGGTERSWVTLGHIKPAMDSLVANGTVREMILVMPNGRNVFDGSFYTNSASAGNWDDFVSKELVSYIDGKYRTLARPESRGLGGHSMGGYGTFTLGMRHAGDVYGALYALSGCCTQFSRDPGRGDTWDVVAGVPSLADVRKLSFYPRVELALAAALSPNPAAAPLFVSLPFVRRDGALHVVDSVYAKWEADAPLDMIPSHAAALERLRGFMFDVGMSDQLVSPASQMAMDTALTRAGVRHTFETYEGDHTNRIAERVATRLLPFFSRTLDFGDDRSP
ncbi:MAG: alpha/beta hydrolase [Gemmatimonadaceae bacterium]